MYQPGDYVKFELLSQNGRESDWLWLEVLHDDPARRLVLGTLDNDPVASADVCRGMQLAVSYDKIRAHRTAASFKSE